MATVKQIEKMNVSPPNDPRIYRDVLARFATGVTIVTARMEDGTPLGATMNSFNSVSIDPPLVLFSVGNRLQSLSGFRRAQGFAIHILAQEQRELALRFGRQAADKWNSVSYVHGFGGAPVLDGALACFECKPFACHPGGDHEIFVVEVVRLTSSSGGDPLIFFSGQLRGLGEDEPAATEERLAHYFF